jgi:hypothetical protein
MLTLGVLLIVLALVGWGARAVLAGMAAPQWLQTVVIVVLLIVAVVLVAQAFGVATPNLR